MCPVDIVQCERHVHVVEQCSNDRVQLLTASVFLYPETLTGDLLLYCSRSSSACPSRSNRLSFSISVFSSRSSRSPILLATISAILLAKDAMTSSSFNACLWTCSFIVSFNLTRLPFSDSTPDGRWTRKPFGLLRVQPIYLNIPLDICRFNF